jgi:hypothetical protein
VQRSARSHTGPTTAPAPSDDERLAGGDRSAAWRHERRDVTSELSRSGWRSTNDAVHETNAYGVAHWHLVAGQTTAEVRDLLGRPATNGQIGERTYWSYSGRDVFFENGRAVEAQAGAS